MPAIVPDLVIQAFANGGQVTAPPQTSSNGFVNFTDGYTAQYELALDKGNPLAKPVERQVQNYMFNLVSKGMQAWQQMSTAPWFASMPNGYFQGARVYRITGTGKVQIYESTADNNLADPLSGLNWERIQLPSEFYPNIPMPTGGVMGSANGNLPSTGVNVFTLAKGTYTFASDANAQAAQNLPAMPGASALAGTLEIMEWPNTSSTTTKMVRYTDRAGNVFTNGAVGTSWSGWLYQFTLAQFQSGANIFATATGGPTAYVATTVPAFTPAQGSVVRVRFTPANGAAATINVNGSGARPIFGPDLVALEASAFAAGDIVELSWSTATSSWVANSGLARPQGLDALTDPQLVNYRTLKKYFTDNFNVDWSVITNKPRVLVWGDGLAYINVFNATQLNLMSASSNNESSGQWASAFNSSDSTYGTTLNIYTKVGAATGGGSKMQAQFSRSVGDGLTGIGNLGRFFSTIRVENGLYIGRHPGSQYHIIALTPPTTDGGSAGGACGSMGWDDDGNYFLNNKTRALFTADVNAKMTLAVRPMFAAAMPYDDANMDMVGAVIPFGGAKGSGQTTGWVLCNGQAISRTAYAELFAMIGTLYGVGNGSTTFNVPDMRGMHLRGWDQGRGRDYQPSRLCGSEQSPANMAHTHTASSAGAGGHTHTATSTVAAGGIHNHTATVDVASAGAHTHTVSGTAASAGSHTHETGGNIHGTTGTQSVDYGVKPGNTSDQTIPAAGAHTHTVSGTAASAGAHEHTATAAVANSASHTHTATTTNTAVGDHTHTLTVNSSGIAENTVWNYAMPFYIFAGVRI